MPKVEVPNAKSIGGFFSNMAEGLMNSAKNTYNQRNDEL